MLSTTGVPAEAQPPFAAQPQTLQPLTMRASSLPPRQRAALFAAFGLGDDIAPTVKRMSSLPSNPTPPHRGRSGAVA